MDNPAAGVALVVHHPTTGVGQGGELIGGVVAVMQGVAGAADLMRFVGPQATGGVAVLNLGARAADRGQPADAVAGIGVIVAEAEVWLGSMIWVRRLSAS